MAIVTDLKFSLDDGLKEKVDLMIDRVTRPTPKKDAVLLCEGGEGEGKTNIAFQIAYYVKYKTGRVFDNSRVFFRAAALLEFAINTENQIIVYDEPSLDMLNAEWWKEEQLNLVKLLMVARKKRHFIIFNITKFYKFNEYIVVDRALGMIHVYSRNEIEAGHFVYIKRKSIEFLYNGYKSSKKRKYREASSLRGTFVDFVDGILDIIQYEKDKDNAILSIGKKETSKDKQEIKELKDKIARLKFPINNHEELAQKLGISDRTLYRWVDSGGVPLLTTDN